MDLFCLLSNQTFVRDFRCGIEPLVTLTQNNDQDLRLFLLRENRPSTLWPFCYDPASGGAGYQCIASLRDVRGFPVTLASSSALAVARDCFSGIFNLSTQEIADFLAGFASRPVAFDIDLTDPSGHKTTPFRRLIELRAIDTAVPASTAVPGEFYLPLVTAFVGADPVTDLDGQTTAERTLGTLFRVIVNISGTPVLSEWRLQAGTGDDGTDLPAGIILPIDYDPVTNCRILVLVNGTAV